MLSFWFVLLSSRYSCCLAILLVNIFCVFILILSVSHPKLVVLVFPLMVILDDIRS